ncbi:MAG: type VI secretion system protein TssA [Gammaproteobacteria bacterium]|jgi:type VI secretion system protein ImpA
MDLDSLLQPISEESPAGVDLRADMSPTSTYNTLKDARNSARAAERKNVFDASDNTALNHWKTVLEIAPTVSANETKDLEITSWYIEALVRTHGFEGLLQGFRVLKGLITQYWDEVYPLPDEEGLETKVASITGLNGQGSEGVLIAPIRNIPITQGGGVDFALWQYKQAVDIQKISDEKAREERINATGFSMDDIQHAVRETADTDVVMLKTTIAACLDEYRQISQLLDERCEELSPPTSNIINVLEDCTAAVNHLYKDRNIDVANDEQGEQPEEATESGGSSKSTQTRVGGPIKSREDAFQQILEISAFFRKTEPHSPVSYVLEKAVKWGRMPLDQLIPELIADGSALEQYKNLTGMNTNNED